MWAEAAVETAASREREFTDDVMWQDKKKKVLTIRYGNDVHVRFLQNSLHHIVECTELGSFILQYSKIDGKCTHKFFSKKKNRSYRRKKKLINSEKKVSKIVLYHGCRSY